MKVAFRITEPSPGIVLLHTQGFDGGIVDSAAPEAAIQFPSREVLLRFLREMITEAEKQAVWLAVRDLIADIERSEVNLDRRTESELVGQRIVTTRS